MHDWIDLIPPARMICTGIVAATKAAILLGDRRRRRVESSGDEMPIQTDPASPAHSQTNRPARPSRALKIVLGVAQVVGAAAAVLSWMHEADVL
jgi:hypothetical protein